MPIMAQTEPVNPQANPNQTQSNCLQIFEPEPNWTEPELFTKIWVLVVNWMIQEDTGMDTKEQTSIGLGP